MNRKEFIISELKNNAQDPFNQYLLALEYLKENNRGEAISLFNNIYEKSPNYLPLYYTFAINLIELGDMVEVKVIVKKGIDLAVLLKNEKVKNELNQLLVLYFD